MKKVAIAFGILVALLVFAKSFGLLVNYTIPTSSNEPTIPVSSHLIATSLKKAKVGDFVTFKTPIPNYGDEVYIKRLCGLPGDEIEMRNGVFFLNGENFDADLTLQHSFIVDAATYNAIIKKHKVNDFSPIDDNRYQINITDKIASEFGIESMKEIHKSSNYGTPLHTDIFTNEQWTRDNFGPVKVPNGKAFFMGDNRHYSYDGRYFGFVSEEKITGTVFGY